MKLRHLAVRESVSRITFSLKESDNKMLDKYVEFVSEEVGQEVPTSDVVAAALKTHLEDDKAFQNWMKKQEKEKAKEAKKEDKPEAKPEAKAEAKPEQKPSVSQSAGGGFNRPGFGN